MQFKTFNLDTKDLDSLKYAVITTNKGVIRLSLFPNDAPQTVANFADLANSKFYDGLVFHRVISNFMAQGGCPIGNGTGGPGYKIKCEINKQLHKRGAISMAHAGPDTGGSQFFICFVPCVHLDGVHTVFGQIKEKESFDVLDKINQNDIIENIRVVESI